MLQSHDDELEQPIGKKLADAYNLPVLSLDVVVTRRKRVHIIDFPGDGGLFSSTDVYDCLRHLFDNEHYNYLLIDGGTSKPDKVGHTLLKFKKPCL